MSPNHFTYLRIALIPLFVTLYAWPSDTHILQIVGFVLFVSASLTDWLDGYLARKWNQVTTLGKFLDPLADKLLVMAAFLLLIDASHFPYWAVMVILAREFAITGLRVIAAEKQIVIAASAYGKIKTVIQLIGLIVFFASISFSFDLPLMVVRLLVGTMVVITLYSGYDYIKKNLNVLK